MELCAVPDDGEGVGADAVAGGFDDSERDGSGDRRVNSVSAGEEHAQAGLGGEWLRGRDDVFGEYRTSARGIRKIPIEIHA